MDDTFQIPSIPLFSQELEFIGCRGSTWKDLVDVVHGVEECIIEPLIGAHFDLEEIDKAADCLENSQMIGRIVLT